MVPSVGRPCTFHLSGKITEVDLSNRAYVIFSLFSDGISSILFRNVLYSPVHETQCSMKFWKLNGHPYYVRGSKKWQMVE